MNDFDNNLKETLEAREIRPSASSWDKLSKQLEQEEKKSKIPFWWMGIAAVFLGGILIGSLVFSDNGAIPESTPAVVEEPPVDPIHASEKPQVVPKHEVTVTSSLATKTNTEKKKRETKRSIRNPAQGNKPAEKNRVAISSSNEEFVKEQNTKKIAFYSPEKEAMASALTAETENLLEKAMLQIEKRAFLAHPKNKVSAQALLQQAERELNRPKRERLFDFVQEKLIQMASASRVFD